MIVLDASVAISLLRGEGSATRVRRKLDEWFAERVELVVPSSFWTEIVNVLTKRHRQSGFEVIEALYELDALTIRSVEVDRPLLLDGLDLVERFGLTIHDAIYLALARSIRAQLATFDRELIAAGGIDIVDLSDDDGTEGGGHRTGEARAACGAPERPVTWPSWPGAGAYLGTLRRQALAER